MLPGSARGTVYAVGEKNTVPPCSRGLGKNGVGRMFMTDDGPKPQGGGGKWPFLGKKGGPQSAMQKNRIETWEDYLLT